MGLYLFSKSSYDEPKKIKHFQEVYTDLESSNQYLTNKDTQRKGNPVPTRFKIKEVYQIGRYLVVDINYPDAGNYEGNKILVYKDLTIEKIRKFTTIDPHFSESKDFTSPIARFKPTLAGKRMAFQFCDMLERRKAEDKYW